MPITLRPTAGTRVYASAGTPATINAAGYAALTWTEVQGFSNVGEIGDSMEVGNYDSLVDGRIKFRSISDPGELAASMADLPADAGQIILKTAFAAARGAAGETISLRIEDATGKGTYARGMVASWRRVYGGAADVQIRSATMPIVAGTIVEY